MTPQTQVQGQPAEGVAAKPAVTPDPQPGVAAQPVAATPEQTPPADAEAAKLKADYEKRLAQYEQDLNRMKSSLQKQVSQKDNEWQEKYNQLQEQFHQARMSSMTEEDREKYEKSLQEEEFVTMQQQLDALQEEKGQMAQILDAAQWFLARGVPADKLVLNEGYDALARSGWDFVDAEMARLRQLQPVAPSSNEPARPNADPKPLPSAPEVDTAHAGPSGGPTWDAYHKAGLTDEDVYRKVESGQWPKSAIPK